MGQQKRTDDRLKKLEASVRILAGAVTELSRAVQELDGKVNPEKKKSNIILPSDEIKA